MYHPDPTLWPRAYYLGALVGRRVWDAGAGIGIVSILLAERSKFLLATEFTASNLNELRENLAGRAGVQIEFLCGPRGLLAGAGE